MSQDEEIQRLQDTVTVLQAENRTLRSTAGMDLKVELVRAIAQMTKATDQIARVSKLLVDEGKRDERPRSTKRVPPKGSTVQPHADNEVLQGRTSPGPDSGPVPEVQ